MVKEIVFDVGRKIHHVPWKYGRYFLFVLLIALIAWYKTNIKYFLI
jgi:hypothetical protein